MGVPASLELALQADTLLRELVATQRQPLSREPAKGRTRSLGASRHVGVTVHATHNIYALRRQCLFKGMLRGMEVSRCP